MSGSTGTAKFTLRFLLDGQPQSMECDRPTVVLGRGSECDVVFPGGIGISRTHSSISRDGNGWTVADMDSRNGTWVNGVRVQRCRLKDGDVIKLGTVEVSFHNAAARPHMVVDERAENSATVTTAISMDDFQKLLAGRTGSAAPPVRGGPVAVAAGGGDDGLRGETVGLVVQLFHDIGQTLMGGEALEAILDKVVGLLLDRFQAERGSICLLDAEANPKFVVNRTRQPSADAEIRISRSILRRVVDRKDALLVSDAMQEFKEAASIQMLRIQSAMCAPLYHQGRVTGIVYLDTTSLAKPFQEQELKVLAAIAMFAAVGVEQAGLREENQKQQKVRERIARYMGPQMVDRIAANPDAGEEMAAEERDASVIFADLTGFTKMSEDLQEPRAVAAVLNAVFERLTDAIFAFEGTLDKYIGDAIMAIFGAPIAQEDHAIRAVAAALRMQRELAAINASGKYRHPIRMRIGVNSGLVVAGDIGSPRRKDYTVIGDVVNVASRLESTVAQPDQVIIGPRTYELVNRFFVCEPTPVLPLKNKTQPVQPYLVLEPRNALLLEPQNWPDLGRTIPL